MLPVVHGEMRFQQSIWLKMRRFLQSWVINTFAVLVAVALLRGIRYDTLLDLFLASLLLGVLNAFVRPLLRFLAWPLLYFTLGLFVFVINALLLYFVGWLLPGFHVAGFWWAFLGALIISIASLILNVLTGPDRFRVVIRHQRRPPDSDRDGGSGPVIDV